MPSNEELLQALEALSAAERKFTEQQTDDAAAALLGVFGAQQGTLEKAGSPNHELKELRDRLLQDGESFHAAVAAARGVTDRGDARSHLRRDYGHRLGAVARDLISLLKAGEIE
jgi:hypothetical protein